MPCLQGVRFDHAKALDDCLSQAFPALPARAPRGLYLRLFCLAPVQPGPSRKAVSQRQVRQNNHPQWRGHHGLATSENRMPGARLSTVVVPVIMPVVPVGVVPVIIVTMVPIVAMPIGLVVVPAVIIMAVPIMMTAIITVMPIMVMPIIVGVDDVCRGGDDEAGHSRRPAKGWLAREARRALRTTTPFPFATPSRGRLEI